MTDYRTPFSNERPEKDPLQRVKTRREDVIKRHSSEYEFVRYGEPEPIKHSDHLDSINRILQRFRHAGYNAPLPDDLPLDLLKAVKKFRATLDCYYEIAQDPIFSRDEVYSRCLKEGHTFTEYLKKCRSTSLRYKTAETETDIDENYVCEGYSGYDSIIHERAMIHWDDRSTVDDIKYCMMPAREVNVKEFEGLIEDYLDHIGITQEDLANLNEVDLEEGLMPTSMYDPKTGKTSLMRHFWSSEVDLSEPYLGKRSVVLTQPGSTRDALVGSPSTVARVKIVNAIARAISEKDIHNANASGTSASDRYIRVLKRHWFIHLDFKKYGLTFPRLLTNAAIRKFCERGGYSSSDLEVHDLFVEIDGEIYATERGTALGWFDCVNAICVNAILYGLQKNHGLKFDWIGFNDDFELGFYDSGDMRTHLNAMREALFMEFDYWDILLSGDKIYGSRASVFLENYCYFAEHYELDMRKAQLAAQAFSNSLVARYPWQAKIHFATAWRVVENENIRERCMATIDVEFESDEIHAPLEFGGWYDLDDPVLNKSFAAIDDKLFLLGASLFNTEIPKFSSRLKKVSSPDEIRKASNNKCYNAQSSAMFRMTIADPGSPEEINLEAETAPQYLDILMEAYTGKSFSLKDCMLTLREHRSSGKQPPP